MFNVETYRMKIFRKHSFNAPLIAYHISNYRFRKFDPSKSAQELLWFSKNKEDLLSDRHGASIKVGDIYLYTCQISPKRTAGWDEYEKKSIMELIRDGYDAIELDDDLAVIDPNIINIIGVQKQSQS